MATSKIKTFAAACKKLKLDPKKAVAEMSSFPARHRKALVAVAKLMIITEAINDGWIPGYNDDNQANYEPVWYMTKDSSNPSGFRFYYVSWFYQYSYVGSRLCFRSREVAEFAAKQFHQLYKDFMTL
jgi:hypothetical protein